MSIETKATTTKAPTKVITGRNTIMSYLNVNEPKVPLGGGKPRYSVTLIIPKEDTVTVAKIRAAIQTAYEQGKEKLKDADGKLLPPEAITMPLRDGDAEKDGIGVYRNAWFLHAGSVARPGVVDADRHPITDTSELYSGIIGRASISFFAYHYDDRYGIAAGLNNIQKLADGEPLGNRSTAEEDFCDE